MNTAAAWEIIAAPWPSSVATRTSKKTRQRVDDRVAVALAVGECERHENEFSILDQLLNWTEGVFKEV